MGRHVAGNGFLRAAVKARGEGPIYGYTPSREGAQGFANLVRQIDPAAETEWIRGDQLARLSAPGVLYLADATVATFARLRQHAGVAAFGLCGVTHTTATDVTMSAIADLLQVPVAPWDALICTSTAVAETVRRIHEAEAENLRWRFGSGIQIAPLLQLPVIPLGVDCEAFASTDMDRDSARASLGIEADEVVSLFVGRYLFHGKAHPLPMYQALQATAERTGKRIVLVMCGWAPNSNIDAAFRSGAAQFAPDVRTIFVDGREADLRASSWRCADLFISLSDGIQETFGLTPIEAMAAGLPVVVSDWNGYRDTVRDGIDGFRVKTWAPMPGMGGALARAYEGNSLNYDHYTWAVAASTSVDVRDLTDRLSLLVTDPDARCRMGQAGRRRAIEVYDWDVVYRSYVALWGDMNARRLAALNDPSELAKWASAPRSSARRLDPYVAFGHYPTSLIRPTTMLCLTPGATQEGFQALISHGLFGEMVEVEAVKSLFSRMLKGPTTVADASAAVGNMPATARAAGLLAKMNLMTLVEPAATSA